MKIAAFFIVIVYLWLAVALPTGDLDGKWLHALLFGATGFVLLLAIVLKSPRIMGICVGFSSLAFVSLWSCVVLAPKFVFGVMYELGAHVLFVSVVSSIHLGVAIFTYMAKVNMFKKDP